MSIDSALFSKAYDLWASFKEEVLYRNRFIVNHEVLEYIKHFAEKNQKTIEKDTILHRARLFTGDDSFISYSDSGEPQIPMPATLHPIKSRELSGFWGYNENESFVPSNSDLVNDGRVNPAFIKYLYTAEEPYTAIVEVRPYLNSKVSVAEIRVNEALNIADFSYEAFGKVDDELEQSLMYLIMSDFSKPSDSDKKSYIPSQYIAEYIKTLGMEGIRFNSSLHGRGRNITIFNFEKCKPVGSKLYKIEDICFEAKAIAPKNERDLIHWKLETYRNNKSKLLPRIQRSEQNRL